MSKYRKEIPPEFKFAAVQEYLSGGKKKDIAEKYGVSTRTIYDWVRDPVNQNPDNAKHDTSTLYDEDGKVKLQWVKRRADKDAYIQIIREAAEGFKSEITPYPRLPKPSHTVADLCNVYVLSDYHLGQLSWHEETGADWDAEIAEKMLFDWIYSAVAQAPDAHTGVFCQLGDFLHADGLRAITPASGHILDADSRYGKVVQILVRVTLQIVNELLKKHENVRFIWCEGNHDESGARWPPAFLEMFYSDNPRFTIDSNQKPYYCYEWGQTSLFFHHGHLKKMKDISSVFAGMYRDVFGRTKYSYAHTGHLHHIDVKEDNLMVVEQHPTLAAQDSYSARGGYNSARGANVITYHKRHGEVSRFTLRPEMFGNRD